MKIWLTSGGLLGTMKIRTPSSSGLRTAATQPGFARPHQGREAEGEKEPPDSAVHAIATPSKMPAAEPVSSSKMPAAAPVSSSKMPAAASLSSAPAPVAIQVAGQVVNVARVSRGTYEVRDPEGSLVGTITLSHGFLQLTAERAPLATMMDIAKIAMGLGVVQLPPPRPVDAPR
jgi:hypothetical protein